MDAESINETGAGLIIHGVGDRRRFANAEVGISTAVERAEAWWIELPRFPAALVTWSVRACTMSPGSTRSVAQGDP